MKHILLALWLTCFSGAAQPALTLQQLERANNICASSVTACVPQVENFITQAAPQSAFWYELTLLKLNALFILHLDEPLLKATSALVQAADMPAYFKANLYVYHAKELLFTGNKLQGQHYLDKATELLEHLTAASRNPLTEVRLVNVQMSMDENRPQGYARLKALELRYRKSGDFAMKFELYNNLGHLASWLHHIDEAVVYRRMCLDAALHTQNVLFQAEAHYNFARQRTKFGDFSNDINAYYQEAMRLYHQIDDELMVEQSRLFLAELWWMQGDKDQARHTLAPLRAELIPEYNHGHLQRIRRLLK